MTVIEQVMIEVQRATTKFPTWPTDPLHALAVLGEEYGELIKAMLQLTYEPQKTSLEEVREEAIQTAAMAIRLAMSLERYKYQRSEQHLQDTVPTTEAHGRSMQETIEDVGRALLTWDKKYPKGIIYNANTYNDCEKELVSIVERFREFLGHNSKSEHALRILKSITLDNICDWQTMDVMQFENLCAQWTERSRSELGKRVMSEPQ